MPIVRMRTESGDCVIASIATALQRPYEEIAAMLGIKLDESGAPDAKAWPWPLDQAPIPTLEDICRRLKPWRPFLVAELLPAFIEMIVLAGQSPAVLIVNSDHPADQGRAHALAVRDGQIIDCRTGSEDDRPPFAALLFLPAEDEVVSEQEKENLWSALPFKP